MDLEKIVRRAISLGVSEVEVYLARVSETSLTLSDVIEASKSTKLSSLGLRVTINKSVAFVGTQDLSDEGIEKTLSSAISIARVSSPDPGWVSMNKKISQTQLDNLFDKDTAYATPEDLSHVAKELLDSVKEGYWNARPVRGAVSARSVEITYMNCYGGPLTRAETVSSLYVYARVDEGGKTGTYDEHDVQRSFRKLRARDVGFEAGSKAKEFLNAEGLPSGTYELILLNHVVSSILPVMIAPAISALNVQQGRSPLSGKLEEEVVSESVSIVDLGASPEALGSKPFDDEGHPTRNTVVFEKGILKTYLYDTYTAFKEGKESTGNASRTFSTVPAPQPHHLRLMSGEALLDELISETKEGVLVMNTIGEWLSNPVSGHLNATITHAYLIRKGRIIKPIKGAVITANIYELLKHRIEAVGKDLRTEYGASAPSLKFRGVKIAGI
ncbi:MAG: TldD/PmbA family protein [Desulfurococcaceae archaeon TW002]